MHGGAAGCVLESSYGKMLSAYYDGVGAPVGSVLFSIVMCHYLSVTDLDMALDASEAIVCIDLGATTVAWYWDSVAERA